MVELVVYTSLDEGDTTGRHGTYRVKYLEVSDETYTEQKETNVVMEQ
jgi:hypothetical protein